MSDSIKDIKYAVFPVGGLGTRFLPATKSIPKEMLPVVDKPLIQYAFEQAVAAGVKRFIFITGRNKSAINNHFDNVYELEQALNASEKDNLLELTKDWVPEPGRIAFIRQQHPLGLGHAISCAKNFIGDNPFLVMLADELLLSEKPFAADMIDLYKKQGGGNVIGVADVNPADVYKYGIIDPLEDNDDYLKVRTMVEKPSVEEAPSNTSIIGHYILEPGIFDYLDKQKAGKGGEIQLTDALNKMAEDEQKTYALRFKGKRFDCGSKQGFLRANLVHALERADMHDGAVEMLKDIIKEWNIN